MKKHRLIFILCAAFYFTKNFGMENENNDPLIAKLQDIFKTNNIGKAEIYYSEDLTQNTICQTHENQYTYYTPGNYPKNLAKSFARYRDDAECTFSFPGRYLAVNGVNNRDYGKRLSLNWQMEAARNIKVIEALYEKGLPIECWETHCYSFWSLACTLYGLKGGNRDAVELRGRLFVTDSQADAMINSLKLIIASSPLLSTQKFLDTTVNPMLERGLITAAFIPPIVNIGSACLSNKKIAPSSFALVPFIGLFKSTIASTLSYYGLNYITSIDQKRGESLQLLYDLSKKEKRIINSAMLVTWQQEDNLTDTMYPEELSFLSNTFTTFYGIGSPYNDHLKDDTRQIRVMNYVRSLHNIPHYIEPEQLLMTGKRHFEEILPFHETKDWAGLKKYTEDPTKYIL